MSTREVLDQGISLLKSDDPGFSEETKRLGFVVSELDPIRPVTVVVRNASARSVVALALRWSLKDSDGNVTTHDVMFTQYNGLLDNGKLKREPGPSDARIQSGASRLFSSAGMIRTRADLSSRVTYLQSHPLQSTVGSIDFDAVILDDGSAIGPDQAGLVERFRAHVDAQQDLMQEISDRLNRGESLHSILVDIQSKTAKRDDLPPLNASDAYDASRWQYLQELVRTESFAGETVAQKTLQNYKYSLRPRINKISEKKEGGTQ